MPTHERQAEYANDNSKVGLAGKLGLGRIEVSSATDQDYQPVYALGDAFNPDVNIEKVGANEVQTVRIQDGTGGTFTITYAGQTTAAIAHDASAITVERALNELSNVTPGDIRATKAGTTADHTYTLNFGGQLARENVAQVTVDSTAVTGTETVTIATGTAGSPS